LTIDQLETFVAIADEGGLRAASTVLNKTQPTLSVAMKNLEEALGLELFDRSSYRMQLSEQGRALYTQAKQILSSVKEMKTLAREFELGVEPELKLAIDYLCPLPSLLSLLKEFQKTATSTQLALDFEVLSGAENKLRSGYAHLAITPFVTDTHNIESLPCSTIEILPVIGRDRSTETLMPAEQLIRSAPQITVRDSSASPNPAVQGFGQNDNAQRWTVSDHLIKKELIVSGFGWGHLEKSSIENELNEGKLHVLESESLGPKEIQLYVARAKGERIGPVAKKLWDFLLSEFSEA